MKYAILSSCLFAAAALTFAVPAGAQTNAAYCLRGQSGATQGTETCAYQTMAQCNAAKAGQNDQCFRNSKASGKAMKSRSTTGSSTKH